MTSSVSFVSWKTNQSGSRKKCTSHAERVRERRRERKKAIEKYIHQGIHCKCECKWISCKTYNDYECGWTETNAIFKCNDPLDGLHAGCQRLQLKSQPLLLPLRCSSFRFTLCHLFFVATTIPDTFYGLISAPVYLRINSFILRCFVPRLQLRLSSINRLYSIIRHN